MNEIKLSVVVIFHNMRREAARTLYTLTTAYQRNIAGSDYEVIAVDSNSKEPLEEEWVRSFGPQFRHLNVKCDNPSPCIAMNFGVAQARNNIVLCIIDGARMLSPCILSRTMMAFRKFNDPFVYTLAMHLGPKVQNESMLEGYDQSAEDKLLESTPWRQNGYALFAISTVAFSSREGFYSKLAESNCFALQKSTYTQMGGLDERFITPGGGLTNLDFFNRANEHESITPVMILGEATFHQYHGGVATNVPLAEHPWEIFAEEYRRVRGKDYVAVFNEPHYVGEIPLEAAHLAANRGMRVHSRSN